MQSYCNVGYCVGGSDGNDVGICEVGRSVGLWEGINDGIGLGAGVGCVDGIGLGMGVGNKDGLWVGDTVG